MENNLIYQLIARASGEVEYLYSNENRRNQLRFRNQILIPFRLNQIEDLVSVFYNFTIDYDEANSLYFEDSEIRDFQLIMLQPNTGSRFVTRNISFDDAVNMLSSFTNYLNNPTLSNEYFEDFSNDINVSSRNPDEFNFEKDKGGNIYIYINLLDHIKNKDIVFLLNNQNNLHKHNYGDLTEEALDLRLSTPLSSEANLLRQDYRRNRGRGINSREFLSFAQQFLNNSYTINRILNLRNLNLANNINSSISRHEFNNL